MDNIAFATEPIFGSLANVLGYLEDRLRQGVPSFLREYTFTDFEIKYGLFQVSRNFGLDQNSQRKAEKTSYNSNRNKFETIQMI